MLTTVSRQRIHGGATPAMLDFGVDVNPFGPPESVRTTVMAHLEAIQRYPDPQARALREALATCHGLSAESILPGNGSAELIALIVQALRPTRGERSRTMTALVIAPTFTEYEWALEQAGASIQYAMTQEADRFRWPESLDGWMPPLDDTDVVFLCNPNNPTGVTMPRDRVLELAARCEAHQTTLVVDEAFVEWTEAPGQISLVSSVPEYPHLVVLRSLTKIFAIPGIRLGYAAASPGLAETLRAHQSAWPLNTFALAVGEQLLKETVYVTRSRRLVRDAVQELLESLRRLPGLHPFPTSTNFILCKLTGPNLTSTQLCAQLAQQGIAVRNCDDFTGLEPGRFIRLGARRPEENALLLAALHEQTKGTQNKF
ncbi:MAG: threonine-phosphate decarboxylase [Candidatus Omnitrophica bacterium]|nr:threonine-phosphate decarboxylase [Candidatus Omnitrophota bacterium]